MEKELKEVVKRELLKGIKNDKFGFCLGYVEDLIEDGLVVKYGFTRKEAIELTEMIVQKYIKEG